MLRREARGRGPARSSRVDGDHREQRGVREVGGLGRALREETRAGDRDWKRGIEERRDGVREGDSGRRAGCRSAKEGVCGCGYRRGGAEARRDVGLGRLGGLPGRGRRRRLDLAVAVLDPADVGQRARRLAPVGRRRRAGRRLAAGSSGLERPAGLEDVSGHGRDGWRGGAGGRRGAGGACGAVGLG